MSVFEDKVVWITGASSGIGEELARRVADQGAKIVLSARNESKLSAIQKELPNPENHLVLPLDLEDSSNFKSLTERVIQVYGRIDYLVNNGGISQRSEVHETPLEIDRRLMEINYFGNIALAKAVLPFFREQRQGHFVVISSIAGKFGFYLRSAYCASKHALHGFYESLLLEEEKNNVLVTMVCPGKINTPISKSALNAAGQPHGVMDSNQANGMDVEECVTELMTAVQLKKKEVLIGKREIKAVKLKRFMPKLFWRVIKNQKAT